MGSCPVACGVCPEEAAVGGRVYISEVERQAEKLGHAGKCEWWEIRDHGCRDTSQYRWSTVIPMCDCGNFESSFEIKPSTGGCPAGLALTEHECKNKATDAADFGTWGGSGTWGMPETCGCFTESNGKRYFNRATGACKSPEAGEKMICWTPIPEYHNKEETEAADLSMTRSSGPGSPLALNVLAAIGLSALFYGAFRHYT